MKPSNLSCLTLHFLGLIHLKRTNPKSNLSKTKIRSLNSLLQNKNIIIQKADIIRL